MGMALDDEAFSVDEVRKQNKDRTAPWAPVRNNIPGIRVRSKCVVLIFSKQSCKFVHLCIWSTTHHSNCFT